MMISHLSIAWGLQMPINGQHIVPLAMAKSLLVSRVTDVAIPIQL